jgi:precorrin-2 dehydrogenase/sirohydrochlorin ferrochelatase
VKYYPVFLNLSGRLCVVVGGGAVAERKTLSLLEAGAVVKVISPSLTEGLTQLLKSGRIQHIPRGYRKADLEGAFLVVAATPDMDLNRSIFRDGKGIPVNVVDIPELCSFIVPSVVRRGPLTIAISTSGVSPALSRSIREEMEEIYGQEFGEYVDFLSIVREKVKAQSGLAGDERARILKVIGSRQVLRMLREEGAEAAKAYVKQVLQSSGIEV